MVAPVTIVPPSPTAGVDGPQGYHAINNPYLVDGPKGFRSYKITNENHIFVRLDIPGAASDKVNVGIADGRKMTLVSAEAPMESKHDSADRKYKTMIVLACDCCEWGGFNSRINDGVLRINLFKRKINPHRPSPMAEVSNPNFREVCVVIEDICHTGPHVYPLGSDSQDPALTGPELKPHPFVCQGPLTAYESKQLQNGSLYLRVDMPGVPPESFQVSVTDGQVRVHGEATTGGMHEFGARLYGGVVAQLERLVTVPRLRIKIISKKNGVIRMIIPPV